MRSLGNNRLRTFLLHLQIILWRHPKFQWAPTWEAHVIQKPTLSEAEERLLLISDWKQKPKWTISSKKCWIKHVIRRTRMSARPQRNAISHPYWLHPMQELRVTCFRHLLKSNSKIHWLSLLQGKRPRRRRKRSKRKCLSQKIRLI